MRVLILAGDIRYNFGDTAICVGVIQLISDALPDCEICVWSSRPLLMAGFEKIEIPRKKPFGLLKLALSSDLIVWGGGQLLQANRSSVKCLFWLVRIGILRVFGKKIVGFGQGLGPFPRSLDKFLAKSVPDHVRLAQDRQRPSIGFSVRYTLHHKQGRVIPFQFLPRQLRARSILTSQYDMYFESMLSLCNNLVKELDATITFVPMYLAPWETDLPLSNQLVAAMTQKDSARVFTPQQSINEIYNELDRFDMFVGTPMHSTILSTSRFVPSMSVYYEPKGFDYFESIGQQRWSMALESVIEPIGAEQLQEEILNLWSHRDQVRNDLKREVPLANARAAKNTKVLKVA